LRSEEVEGRRASAFGGLVLEVDAELAELDDRGSAPADRAGENGSVNGIPFALRSGLPSRRTR
jgi:hypothetical protein